MRTDEGARRTASPSWCAGHAGILAAGTTGVSLAADHDAGIVDRFRSLSMSRIAVLAGRTSTDLVRNIIAPSLMLAAGFLLGFRPQGGLPLGVGAADPPAFAPTIPACTRQRS